MEVIKKVTSQRAVVIFSMNSCDMCHAIKRLFLELGCNPLIYELDEEAKGREVQKALVKLLGRSTPIPAVFIASNLVGSTDHVMSLHLAGCLVPLLRQAGALWL